jgi:hypothetical protein
MNKKTHPSGIDWQGLFKWSAQYTDGTKPTEVNPLTEEDRKWLEKVIAEYTFDEADRMGEITKVLCDHMEMDKGKLLEAIDELHELIDIHPRNGLNLVKSGGFKLLMDAMFNNPHEAVRRMAMQVFSS